MSEDPTETPTEDQQQAKSEGKTQAKNWIRIAVFATFGTFLLALGLLQATGMIDLLAPVVDSQTGQGLVFVVLAAIVFGLGAWSWSTA